MCRLTYYGFNSLQIVDRSGPHPMDRDRHGMSVAEGAAMLLLTAADQAPPHAVAEVVGGGLSCDAYHPAAPHPEGRGAREAMLAALEDAGLSPDAVDYINLHGTGTVENDLAEAAALKSVFINHFPPVSSVKGSFGHSLAAAGAIEAVVAALCLREGFMPANVGWRHQDEAIGFRPLTAPRRQPLKTVLSNSFGFGGNNAALVFADLESGKAAGIAQTRKTVGGQGVCLPDRRRGDGGDPRAVFSRRILQGDSGGRSPDGQIAAPVGAAHEAAGAHGPGLVDPDIGAGRDDGSHP
jgi:3-oxoacyl-(acyl-carrier-protein) synthase